MADAEDRATEDRKVIDELVQKARVGNTEAFEELCTKLWPYSYRIANRILKSREDAEDTAQEVWFLVSTRIRKYDSRKAAFTTWLYLITWRRAVRVRKKNRNRVGRSVDLGDVDGLPDPRGSARPESGTTRADLFAVWYRAQKVLSEDDLEALWLYFREGLKDKEIAEIMSEREGRDLHRTTITKRRKKAFDELRKADVFADLEVLLEGED